MPELNRAQREAVEHVTGPLLVLAGAGSGKTRVLTHRIAALVSRKIAPDRILAVSFTNKAAGEMGERMTQLVGAPVAERLWLSTFHRFGVRFLREESRALGYGGKFVIFDQSDGLGLVRELVRRSSSADERFDLQGVLARISLWKNRFVDPAAVPETDDRYGALAREVYARYESALRTMHAVDFDDLVVAPVRLLRRSPELRTKWSGRFDHLLIDEFQDTNHAQLELVRLLANAARNVCVVGDDDQSIYGWRGAEVGNILDFERHFPGARVIKLETNYRSVPEILAVANAAIGQARTHRHGKVLRAVRAAGQRVRLVQPDDAEGEARFVAKELRSLAAQGTRWSDVAVLYRSNGQARLLEEELRAAQIPYRVLGGTQFFDRKEVKDAAAYLRVVANPRDELSLRRVVNYPARGIGDTTVERLTEHAQTHRTTLLRALERAATVEGVPETARRAAKALVDALETCRGSLARGVGLTQATHALFDAVGLTAELRADTSPAGARRVANLEFLLRAIGRYEATPAGEKPSLGAFLHRITLESETTSNEAKGVTLCTLHGAKGLEFDTVFLVGCVEGQLPHARTTDPKASEASPTDVEEERRLFYVGVTRAQARLYLVCPKRRALRGKLVPLVPSRFLEGLPEAATKEYQHVDERVLGPQEIADMTKSFLAGLGGERS